MQAFTAMKSDKEPREKNVRGGGEDKGKDYARQLRKLHVELVKLQEWVRHAGRKVCIVFEGRDGAGKGGTIKAITARVSPRIFKVVALAAPTEREKSQMYIQRYLPHLPAAGEVVIFDRSWYNRAGVERVMKFCSEDDVERFLKAVPNVEKAIVNSGVILLKYWLEVGPEEQTKRLKDNASMIAGKSGSSPRWICCRTAAGTTTPRRATTCSGRRIPHGPPGSSRDPTTRGVPG